MLPSRSDCTPAVLREAGAFGLPCITTNIGGIPSLIRENYNGKMFDLTADISESCEYILHLFKSKELYQEISLNSYQEYTNRLNWKTAGNKVRDSIIELL
ncbi:glycosyltransferase [Oscillatoria laete-virens NRMC-F 0139]|nr:glycosyltransferase [Oscillatoria laete-virens NRMC-F 0139]